MGAADPVGIARFLRAYVDLVEVVEPERLHIAMNRLRPSAIGPGPLAQVVSTLERFGGIHASVVIPLDQGALDSAVLAGRTVQDAAPKSSVRQAVAELVSGCLLPAHPLPMSSAS